MKIKGTDKIVSSYNPLAWDNNSNGEWKKIKNSFIFSLKNGNIQNSTFSRVNIPLCTIINVRKKDQTEYGLHFGNFWMCSFQSNFTLDNGYNCNSNNYYEKSVILSGYFSIVNYKVFRIVRK